MKKTVVFLFIASLLLCAACGKAQEVSHNPVALDKFYAAEAEKYGMPPMASIAADEADSACKDLGAVDLAQAVFMRADMSLYAYELLLVETKTSGDALAVQKLFEAHREEKLAGWGDVLPEQKALIEGARIVLDGNYVLFIISARADDIAMDFADARILPGDSGKK